MRKIYSLLFVVSVATITFAQSASELAKQQAELNAIHMKMINTKPTKDARKQAKELRKEGWSVPAGSKSLEGQITESQLYGAELMTDDQGSITKRFLIHSAFQTSGSYNAGYAAARAMAQTELAAMLKADIVAAMQSKIDNAQSSGISSATVDKFNERARSIVDATLTNSIPVFVAYRRLPNNHFEVQIRLAFDKKELVARLKRNMQQELEMEGDSLNTIIDEVFSSKI